MAFLAMDFFFFWCLFNVFITRENLFLSLIRKYDS